MTSKVFYGSPRQAALSAKETLPAKLDLILDALHLRDRVKDEMVCLKLHVGNNIGYSVIHPVFVRKVVAAIKEGGGKPFIVDVDWDVAGCETRGYTQEVLGCPVYPAAGPKDNYFYEHEWEYKNMKIWKVAGMVEDASFLVNFSHVKGHPACGFGAAFKNIALGCMVGDTRGKIHDTNHFDQYWFKENCPDRAVMQRIVDSCPFGAIVFDQKDPDELHLHFEPCNQCMRCQQVAPPGSLKIDAVNFHSFQEACAISTAITLSTFAKDKSVHLALATQMTPVCDCFGFTSMPILNDAGIFGSDDIVSLDKAVLDQTANLPLLLENIPDCMEPQQVNAHPFAQLHGKFKDPYVVVRYAEKLGLGSQDYDLVDVLPVECKGPAPMGYYVSAK
ncbi:MAG: DUF362 domain-containing protein [Chloroflexi bacterium]|nr:DUF362 domain-containing protein [Chloroflexota bacterium]